MYVQSPVESSPDNRLTVEPWLGVDVAEEGQLGPDVSNVQDGGQLLLHLPSQLHSSENLIFLRYDKKQRYVPRKSLSVSLPMPQSSENH